MGRSTENSNKKSNSAYPDKANKTPELYDDGCSLSITRLIEAKFKELTESLESIVNSLMSLKILIIPKILSHISGQIYTIFELAYHKSALMN